MEFPCTKCSACCRVLDIPLIYSFPLSYHENKIIDRGDGTCVNLDTKTNLCKIYDTRPRLCRMEGLKPKKVSDKDWIKVNIKICQNSAEKAFGDASLAPESKSREFTKKEIVILDKLSCLAKRLTKQSN